jgi:hypothetical protein
MAYYGFGNASSAGFGSTVERPDGLQGRYGLWGADKEHQSFTYQELCNLVETVEEEAAAGYLKDREFWLFMDNSMAESCFFKGGSSLKLLHNLVLRLRKAELHYGFTLHMVHVAGTRMIAQGTDGLLRGTFSEDIVAGKDMLTFVDISLLAVERHPPILEFVQSWVGQAVGKGWILKSEEWFVEGHSIIGEKVDAHGIWIPIHAGNGMAYIWSPPPVIADVALEECLKAIHKRSDAFHIFLVPRLYSPLWLQLFYKLSDFSFHISPGSLYWPSLMHEPLFVGIVLPLPRRKPWSLQRMPLLVGLERKLHGLPDPSKANGRDILCKFLRVPRRFAGMPEDLARRMLHVSGDGKVPSLHNGR